MKKMIALNTINQLSPGSVFNCEDGEAKRLIECGAAMVMDKGSLKPLKIRLEKLREYLTNSKNTGFLIVTQEAAITGSTTECPLFSARFDTPPENSTEDRMIRWLEETTQSIKIDLFTKGVQKGFHVTFN